MLNRWVTVGLVAVATLGLAGMAIADVPSDLTSTVSCYCVPDALGGSGAANPDECTICPDGDGAAFGTEDIHVDVIVRNVLGQPLAGSTVTITENETAQDTVHFNPAETTVAVSNASGQASFVLDEGGVAWNEPAGVPVTLPNLDFTVTAVGPGPGGAVVLNGCDPDLKVVSFDMRAGPPGLVGLQDFGDFAAIFGQVDPRGDFNWSGGVVGLPDFGAFAFHFGHAYP